VTAVESEINLEAIAAISPANVATAAAQEMHPPCLVNQIQELAFVFLAERAS